MGWKTRKEKLATDQSGDDAPRDNQAEQEIGYDQDSEADANALADPNALARLASVSAQDAESDPFVLDLNTDAFRTNTQRTSLDPSAFQPVTGSGSGIRETSAEPSPPILTRPGVPIGPPSGADPPAIAAAPPIQSPAPSGPPFDQPAAPSGAGQTSSPPNPAPLPLRPDEGKSINTLSRESVGPRLVTGEGDISSPKVAPFIVSGAVRAKELLPEGKQMAIVDFVLYDGVDELDFCAPFDVLASCRRLVEGRWSDRPAFKVETVAEYRSPVRCANGLCIIPDRTFDMATEADIVIVPGGPGAQRDPLPPKMIEYLQIARDSAELIASVCTGVFIVAKSGLADHHQVTTHQARLADLRRQHPKAVVVAGQRVVTDPRGHIMSTGGISCGIDLALLIIQRFEGRDTAAYAAKRLEWPLPTAAVTTPG